jgi:hypothetical protein
MKPKKSHKLESTSERVVPRTILEDLLEHLADVLTEDEAFANARHATVTECLLITAARGSAMTEVFLGSAQSIFADEYRRKIGRLVERGKMCEGCAEHLLGGAICSECHRGAGLPGAVDAVGGGNRN